MHQNSDLLFEAVNNSIEAGCKRVDIKYVIHDTYIDVSVKDDGSLCECENPFEENISTKGKDRGNGLSIIKKHSVDARLEREGGVTTLSYKISKDGSLKNTLPYIFNLAASISLTFTLERGLVVKSISSDELLSQYGDLTTVRTLSALKRQFLLFDGI